MTHEYLLWLCLFAYAAHIFEEGVLGWKEWTDKFTGDSGLSWTDFYLANSAVIVTGFCCGMIGWKIPSFALLFPALQLINAIFFHIGPTIVFRVISPGVFTATFLFLPIASMTYHGALVDGVLTLETAALSFMFGTLVMSSPFFFLFIKRKMMDGKI